MKHRANLLLLLCTSALCLANEPSPFYPPIRPIGSHLRTDGDVRRAQTYNPHPEGVPRVPAFLFISEPFVLTSRWARFE